MGVLILGFAILLASFTGTGLLGWAIVLAGRKSRAGITIPPAQSVSVLKPLHGDEPNLSSNLASFLRQDLNAPIQLVCGVGCPEDGALLAVHTLQSRDPGAMTVVVDQGVHGRNPKVSNLLNMVGKARHDVLVLSDSDIAVDPHYVTDLLTALSAPGVGAVTCLYRGRGDANVWSRLVAMGIDLQFLPSALIGIGTGLGAPCMGSTIAIRRETLAQAGGLEALADTLADDHALGAAVKAIGLKVVIADTLVVHACAETSLMALVRHELRWNATVASIDRAGYAGSVVLHPLPLAIVGGLILGFHTPVLAAMCAAVGVRVAMAWRIRRLAGEWSGSVALIPVRDMLSFILFIASFFVRTVDWRGNQLSVDPSPLRAAPEVPA